MERASVSVAGSSLSDPHVVAVWTDARAPAETLPVPERTSSSAKETVADICRETANSSSVWTVIGQPVAPARGPRYLASSTACWTDAAAVALQRYLSTEL